MDGTLNNQFTPIAEQQGVLYTFASSLSFAHPVPPGLVVAFNATTGAQLWATPVAIGTVMNIMMVSGVLFIESSTAPFETQHTFSIVAMRPSDGHILWNSPQPAVISSISQMLFDSERLYLIAGPPNQPNPLGAVQTTQIVALDQATGRREWGRSYDNVVSHVAVVIGNDVICLALALPNGSEAVTAISDRDGSIFWTRDISDTIEALAAGPNAVYVDTLGNTLNGQLFAYALLSGDPLWNIALVNQYIPFVYIASGVIYIATANDSAGDTSTLDARNASTGALLWRLGVTGEVLSMALAE